MRMKFITTTEAGKKWDLSSRRVGVLCSDCLLYTSDAADE